jgi:hypothetical protein
MFSILPSSSPLNMGVDKLEMGKCCPNIYQNSELKNTILKIID